MNTPPPPASDKPSPPELVSRTEAYRVDLGGIISLLSQHLYSQGPDVIVRELLQNAADALTSRKRSGDDFPPRIEFACYDAEDGGYTLSVTDNGAGIDAEDITDALGTIGFSTKRGGEDEVPGDSPFIGRFGVGLLSGFMVAPEIHVISRKCGPDSVPFHWIGHSNGRWEVRALEQEFGKGTRVYLHLDGAGAERLPAKRIPILMKTFGEYLPAEITFETGGNRELERIDRPPFWGGGLDKYALHELGNQKFDEPFPEAFPIHCASTKADGVAFVSGSPISPGTQLRHRLYVRRMLVGEKIRDIAPPDLPFLRCLINAQDLQINAAREDLHGEESRRKDLQKAIADGFDAHLRHLKNTNKVALIRLLRTHYECLLRSAESNNLHLEMLAEFLPLHTTLGEESATAIVRRFGEILHISDEEEFARVELRAIQEGVCIVRSNTLFTSLLLSLIERRLPSLSVKETSSTEFLNRFRDSEETEQAGDAALLQQAKLELQPDRCKCSFGHEDDLFSPATLVMDDEDSIFRSLFADDESQEEKEKTAFDFPKELVFNRNHPIVISLLSNPDMGNELIRAWVRTLYHHALLSARERPTSAESRRHAGALVTLWNSAWQTSEISSLLDQ